MILWILYRKRVDVREIGGDSKIQPGDFELWTMGKDNRYLVTSDSEVDFAPGTFWATNWKSEIRDFLRNNSLDVGKRRFWSEILAPLRGLDDEKEYGKYLWVGFELVSKYPNAIEVPKYPHVPTGIETSDDVWDETACSVEFWKDGGKNGEDLVVAQGDYYTAKIPARELYEYLRTIFENRGKDIGKEQENPVSGSRYAHRRDGLGRQP